MSVHIEGMGVMGCTLANLLEDMGVPFTWSEADAKHVAWRASTGCIYPGGPRDMPDWEAWREWARRPWAAPYMEEASHWFNRPKPPHGARHKAVPGDGPLWLGELPSLHLNVQRYVLGTRTRLASAWRPAPGNGEQLIVAHGFSDRLVDYVWGWSRLVKLRLDPALETGRRACIYIRKGLPVMAYAYPAPGTPWWYAGSTMLPQKQPKEKDPAPKYARWERLLEEHTEGMVAVAARGRFAQGWRPRGSNLRSGKVRVTDQEEALLPLPGAGGKLVLPPMWHSGVRRFPTVWRHFLKAQGWDGQ